MSDSRGTLLLTGANGGIATGFATQFLKSPFSATISGYYGVRDATKADHIRNLLKNHAPSNHEYRVSTLDLSSLESVRRAAKEINDQVSNGSLPPIRALVLNAGVQDYRQNFTNDGIEHTFALNYLHNFLLVLLLLQSIDRNHGRIIYISSTSIDVDRIPHSDAYKNEEQKAFFTTVDKLAKGEAPIEAGDEFNAGLRRYAMSKAMMVMFMHELQKRLNASPVLSSISILGLDPGWVSSGLGRDAPFFNRIIMQSFQYLALFTRYFWPNPLLRTATRTGNDLVTVCFDMEKFGEFPKALHIDGVEIIDTPPQTKDQENWVKLWQGSLKWAGIEEGDTILEDWK